MADVFAAESIIPADLESLKRLTDKHPWALYRTVRAKLHHWVVLSTNSTINAASLHDNPMLDYDL